MHYSTIVSGPTNTINLRRIGQHLSPSAHLQTDPLHDHSPISRPEQPALRHVLSSSQLSPATPTTPPALNSPQTATSPHKLRVFSPRPTNPEHKYIMGNSTAWGNKDSHGTLNLNRDRKVSENNVLSPRQQPTRLALSNVGDGEVKRKSWQFAQNVRKEASFNAANKVKAPLRKHSNEETQDRSYFGPNEQKWTEISDFKLSDGSSAGDNPTKQSLLLPKPLDKGNRKKSDNEAAKKVPSFLTQPKKHRSSMGEHSPFPKRPSLQNFVLLKELGSGAFGRVLLVVEKQLGLVCALKVIPKKVIAQQNMMQQVVRQLKTQSFISHPHIIKIYGYFEDLLHFYIAMEYAMDGQLYERLSTATKPFEEEEACTLFSQICSAVSCLHSQGIIHRDLKPQNIMLHANVVKIGDFGWSVHRGMQLRSTFCGTPLYLSPQQLMGQQYDESIDIWTIGVILYQLLYNSNPFRIAKDTDLVNIVQQTAYFDPTIPVSAEAKDLISRCLTKDPKERLKIREIMLHPFVVRGLQLNEVRKS